MKQLSMNNGDVWDADRVCETCEGFLRPAFAYCPYCGDEL